MLRSRAVKRKEHLELTWSPGKRQLVQPSKVESETVSSIFHTQLKVDSDEGEGMAPKISAERLRKDKPRTFWMKSKFRKAEGESRLVGDTVFRRGLKVWRNLEEDQTDNRRDSKRRFRFSPVRWWTQVRSSKQQLLKLSQIRASFFKGINWTAVAWGWVIALSFTLVVLGAGALYVAFTPGSVYYLSTYLMLNKVVSPLLGGIVAGWKAGQKGWQSGMWVGAGYGLAILVFRLYGELFSAFWLEAALGLLLSIAAGIIGGVLGRVFIGGRKAKESLSSSSS
ncbi:MAG: TIGR04086 family membrane protein [Syntrophomonadaceae bacterium]|nr:TIGR04086 family membrane protein [Syntrophomonadaceae bacterium]